VVDFSDPYHVILGWPYYMRFMAIPSYGYLKLKILRPAGVITVETKAQWALDYEKNNIELAATTVTVAEPRELCLRVSPASTGPAMPSSSSTFKAVDDAKAMQIDIEDTSKTVQIRAGLNLK
jgi:hypothetical protein